MYSTSGYDRLYTKSISGVAKLLCMFFSVSGIICILLGAAPLTNPRGFVYIFVMLFACLATALVYLEHYCEMRHCRRHHCNATKYELYLHAALATTCFLVSSAVLTLSLATYSVAAFFGYVTFCLYALEAWYNYRKYIQRDVSTQTIL
ncbi:uncharacterized protein [Eurosta solidaginis]|uniref:uncharacterized protein n=1 Tax=Eurosta solidaginis TaxID=178769 RepID=UPI003530A8B3